MSLLGIDAGTTGCKTVIFSEQGNILATAYGEYDITHTEPGVAELDSYSVWEKIKQCIQEVCIASKKDPVRAISVSSLGEAMVPVTNDRKILGPSILHFDKRGEEYLPELKNKFSNESLYSINGNIIGNNYSLSKLMWIKRHQPELYNKTDKFLLWGSFISFMLGSEPVVDYSLANRTLLFDINTLSWSDDLLDFSGIDRRKLPEINRTGSIIGEVSNSIAKELKLPAGVKIISGAHDQCVNALGCGVIKEGNAMYGMGTFLCIVSVFNRKKESSLMLSNGLSTEHHVLPGKYVTFIYNQGGSLFKWFRNTFASRELQIKENGKTDIYSMLTAEMPEKPSSVIALPHFTVTGTPDFIVDSCGLIAGLKLETSRGDILKGLLEGATFYMKECVDALPSVDIKITDYRAVGGGSKSDDWLQLSADIMDCPFLRPCITEAGSLGAAIIAGTGYGIFSSFEEGVQAMVKIEKEFIPDPHRHEIYKKRFQQYKELWPLFGSYLRKIN